MRYNSILETIGNTPHVGLLRLFPHHNVWIKDERRNPTGSIKDRAALAMIEDGEKKGIIGNGSMIVEPTSGNTGIGLAMVAMLKGYRLILTMPESMSMERRKILKALGAEIVLTPALNGMQGAIDKALEIVNSNKRAWMPMQFENPANPKAHYQATAEEIIADFPDGIDVLVAGVGTAGHISGIGARLKETFPKIKIFAVEPNDSPVLSGGQMGTHGIQGIGAGFVPKNYNCHIVDHVISVATDDAFHFARKLYKTEGILAGISTGANIAAVNSIQNDLHPGKTILTFAYDGGERYLSIEDLWRQ